MNLLSLCQKIRAMKKAIVLNLLFLWTTSLPNGLKATMSQTKNTMKSLLEAILIPQRAKPFKPITSPNRSTWTLKPIMSVQIWPHKYLPFPSKLSTWRISCANTKLFYWNILTDFALKKVPRIRLQGSNHALRILGTFTVSNELHQITPLKTKWFLKKKKRHKMSSRQC